MEVCTMTFSCMLITNTVASARKHASLLDLAEIMGSGEPRKGKGRGKVTLFRRILARVVAVVVRCLHKLDICRDSRVWTHCNERLK